MNSFSDISITEYLKLLGSHAPAPGGGSASAIVTSLGFGLIEKVAVISSEKDKNLSFAKEIEISKTLCKDALKIADQDAKAYTEVVRAYQVKAVSDTEKAARREKIDEALSHSFKVVVDLLEILAKGEALRRELLKKCQGSIASDLGVAGNFFEASVKGAKHLAEVNLDCIKKTELKAGLTARLAKLA